MMNGYEGLRLEMQTRLLDEGRSVEDVESIINTFCLAAQGYTIEKAPTDIIVYTGIPRVVDEYLACKLMEGLSEKTIKNYRDRLYHFFKNMRKPYDEITSQDIRYYMLAYQQEREKPVVNRTMNAYQGTIKRFFGWLQDVGYITNDPSKGMAHIKYEKKKKQSMTRHDLVILMDACKNVRQKAIISLLYATGCRVMEVVSMKKDDINWHDKSIVVLGKGNKHRTVYFNDQADVYLRQYLDSRTDENPYVIVATRGHHSITENAIQQMVYRMYKGIKDDISLKLSPHIIRHTTTTLAIESGMPVTSVQSILGHASLETTMEYVDMTRVDVKNDYRKYVV